MNEFIENTGFIKLNEIVLLTKDSIHYCKLPYPGHKKGCPNIGKNKKCPPFVSKLENVYDLHLPKYLYFVKFNLELQRLKMKLKHPNWSDKKCRCLLYWQKTVIKRLKEETQELILKLNKKSVYDFNYELIPEAMGLNVFSTAFKHGIYLEKNPQKYVYKISFIGVKYL